MNLFDCFKFVVRLPSQDAGFFVPICPPSPLGNYLLKISAGCVPGFSDVPTLYPFRSASFLVRELRRVGYNARLCPFFFLIVRDVFRSFVSRLRARLASKAKWKS